MIRTRDATGDKGMINVKPRTSNEKSHLNILQREACRSHTGPHQHTISTPILLLARTVPPHLPKPSHSTHHVCTIPTKSLDSRYIMSLHPFILSPTPGTPKHLFLYPLHLLDELLSFSVAWARLLPPLEDKSGRRRRCLSTASQRPGGSSLVVFRR